MSVREAWSDENTVALLSFFSGSTRAPRYPRLAATRPPYIGTVFPNPSGEHNDVHPVHGRRVGPDVLLDPVDKYLNGHLEARLSPLFSRGDNVVACRSCRIAPISRSAC